MRLAGLKSTSPGDPADVLLARRVESEVERMREALAQLIELSGMSRREVERRLYRGGCGIDLWRLLTGRLQLRMKHVLAICRVIELEPLEFVQIALTPQTARRSALLQRIEALLRHGEAEAGVPAPRPTEGAEAARSAEDLMRQVNEFMRREADGRATSANRRKD